MTRVTGRARELGAMLRRHREAAEWTEIRAARTLRMSAAQLCRIEAGSRGITEVNVARCLTLYGVFGDELDEILALAREVNDCYRLKGHNDKLPDELRSLIHYETTASQLDWYEPALIPGQLQTEQYARAIFEWTGLFEGQDLEALVRVRMDRQRLLQARQRPDYRFFIHENALSPTMISEEIMQEQCMLLMFACGWRDCEVRIVPAAAGPVAALVSNSFLFMRYADYHPTVYVENVCTSEFLEAPEVLRRYRAIVGRLASLALSAEESRERLASLAT